MADALPVTDPVEVMCAGCYTRVAKRTQKCDKCGNLYCDRICRRHDKEHTEEVCKQMANVRGQGWNLPEIEQKMGRENVSWLFSHYLSEGKLQELIEEAQEDEKDDMQWKGCVYWGPKERYKDLAPEEITSYHEEISFLPLSHFKDRFKSRAPAWLYECAINAVLVQKEQQVVVVIDKPKFKLFYSAMVGNPWKTDPVVLEAESGSSESTAERKKSEEVEGRKEGGEEK